MNAFERGIRKAVRYASGLFYEYERRKRQRQLRVNLPRLYYLGEEVRTLKRHHRAYRKVEDQMKREMMRELGWK